MRDASSEHNVEPPTGGRFVQRQERPPHEKVQLADGHLCPVLVGLHRIVLGSEDVELLCAPEKTRGGHKMGNGKERMREKVLTAR